jgi:YVTN family beta-propeller protein
MINARAAQVGPHGVGVMELKFSTLRWYPCLMDKGRRKRTDQWNSCYWLLLLPFLLSLARYGAWGKGKRYKKENIMPHRSEQENSVKNVTQNGGIDRLGWGRRLGLLSLIGALGPLWFGTMPAQAAPFAYIASGGAVSVIDTATNTVTATVPKVPTGIGVAVHPTGTFVYVTNQAFGTISVIDTATNTVTRTVPVGASPTGVAAHPAGTFVYVANLDSNTVSVINTTTNTVIATVPVGTGPFGVAVHPAGTSVYVTNESSNTVSVIDTATNVEVATVPVGTGPQGVAVHPAGTCADVEVRGWTGR